MEDRIKIGDVWYVKENTIEESELDITYSVGCTSETKDYCWEATRLCKTNDFNSSYGHIDIKFTDKTLKPWKEEHWDNDEWVLGVFNNNPTSMTDAKATMNEQGIKDFKQFIKHLIDNNWL